MELRRRGLIALAGAALSTAACGPPALPRSAPSPLLGKALPHIQRRTIDGRTVDSHAGQQAAIVVKFFAQYCAPCKHTLPSAQALAMRRRGVLVIGVAEDEDESVVRALVAAYGLSFPVIHDRERVLAGRFRVSDIPATFVAGPDGTLRWVGGPEQRPSDLEQAVLALGA